MNTESKELIKNRIAELPEGLRTFVQGEIWRESVSKIVTQFNLKEEQGVALENEVFLTLLCFEPPSDLKENIKTELGLDENAGRRIADSLNGAVLGRVMKEVKQAWAHVSSSQQLVVSSKDGSQKIVDSSKVENTKVPENVEIKKQVEEKPEPKKEDDLEIMRRAMQPAVPKMEAPKAEPPANLPVKGYEGSKDPYREPVE